MKRPRRLRMLLSLALLGLVVFVAVSAYYAWRFTTPVRRPLDTPPEKFLTTYETVRFPARDGLSLAGWFAPCTSDPATKKAVVLLHGFGGRRTAMLARAKFFTEHGYAALLYDARAHGLSDGKLGTFGYTEPRDLLGALDWLRTRGFTEFGCVGVSQGGATIAFAGPELRDVRWAVLESVYPDLPNAMDRRFRRMFYLPGPIAGCLMIPFAEWRLGLKIGTISPRDAIKQLPCPVLILTGEDDQHTFPTDARQVYDAATVKKSWHVYPGAAHVDLYGFAHDDYERRLLEFIASAQAR